MKDLVLDKSRIRVGEKGDKERYVPFTPDAQRTVYRYLKARRVCVGNKDHYQELLIGKERRPLGYNEIRQITRKLLDRTRLHVKDQHHIFRRTWAYRDLKGGVPVKFVQLVGGWSNLATMEVYARAMQSDDAMDVEWH